MPVFPKKAVLYGEWLSPLESTDVLTLVPLNIVRVDARAPTAPGLIVHVLACEVEPCFVEIDDLAVCV